MSKVKLHHPNLDKNPEYPVIEGYLFIVPNPASKIVVRDDLSDFEKEEINGYETMFGNDLTYKPFVEIWAHNAPVEGSESNWTDHGIPMKVQEKAGIKFSRPRWRDGLFFNRIPYEWVKGKNDGDHIYLEYEDDSGHKAYFDMVCDQANYRYRNHGDFKNVVEKVMTRFSLEA